jgi:hypothetical protein
MVEQARRSCIVVGGSNVFAAVVAISPIGTASAQDIPRDERSFIRHVAERVRNAVGGAPVQIKGPLTLSVGKLQANLDRIYAFCKHNAAGCAAEVDTYVRGVARSNVTRVRS